MLFTLFVFTGVAVDMLVSAELCSPTVNLWCGQTLGLIGITIERELCVVVLERGCTW